MILLFLACGDKSSDSSDLDSTFYSGEELVERFNTATCDLLIQSDCVEILASCNAPVNSFGDWAECMNSQTLNFTHCSNIPYLFEQNQSLVLKCIELLEGAECEENDLCIDGEPLLRTADCSGVNDLIVSNCTPF